MNLWTRRWIPLKTQQCNKALRSKRGESLMEAVASMLILSILLTTIVSIIRFSLAMTGESLADAEKSQDEFNELVLNKSDSSSEANLTFSSDYPINATHSIDLHTDKDGNIIAFFPN